MDTDTQTKPQTPETTSCGRSPKGMEEAFAPDATNVASAIGPHRWPMICMPSSDAIAAAIIRRAVAEVRG